jgi:hypothetical protein
MEHKFNDSVIYIRNGHPIPAIVLKSQVTPDGELLTLLYAAPALGPQLLAQGTTRGIAQVQPAVAPFVKGNLFGWKEWGEVEPVDPLTGEEAVKAADEVFGPVEPGAPESPHALTEKQFNDTVGSLEESGVTLPPQETIDAAKSILTQRAPGPPQPPSTGEHPVA